MICTRCKRERTKEACKNCQAYFGTLRANKDNWSVCEKCGDLKMPGRCGNCIRLNRKDLVLSQLRLSKRNYDLKGVWNISLGR